MLKHAFLLIVHDSPALLQRMVNRLAAPNHYFFIHLDKKSRSEKIDLTGINGEYIADENRIRTSHGGFSLVRVEDLLLRTALNHPVRFDYFHLISGHDYPVRSNREFDTLFERHEGKSFMHYDSEEEHAAWQRKYALRVNCWDFRDFATPLSVNSFFGSLFTRLFPRRFSGEVYAGWQWFSWHRSVAEWVVRYWDSHPAYVKRFRLTRFIDEIFYHVMLQPHLAELKIEHRNSLRYIDWNPRRQYTTLPLILNEQDYESIVGSDAVFCRKVTDTESSGLLDRLDALAESAGLAQRG